jgi:glycosyltransferase involved in cell wall biosynthesis
MGFRASVVARDYSWEKIAKEVLVIYQNLLGTN